MIADGQLKLRSHSFLISPGERRHHPPVPALQVTLPGSTTPFLQYRFMVLAELPKIGKPGNHHFQGLRRSVAGIPGKGLLYQGSISQRTFPRPGRIKPRMLEKLTRASCHHKTMVGVIGFLITAMRFPFSGRIVSILPYQFIGVGKSVGIKFERAISATRLVRARRQQERCQK